MANKKVIVEVEADADVSDVEPLEKKINELRQRRLNFEIETNTSKLDDVKARITELENKKATLDVDADDAEIKKIDDEIEALKFEEIDLNLKTAQAKVSLDEVESEMQKLESNEIEVNLRNQSAMEALDQIGQGFDRLKQGASEVGQAMGDVLESAGRMEQTETFLSMNLGADVAKKKLEEIRSVTDKLPGDDVTLQNLLSQAALKDANMTTEAFTQMGSAAADYMAAMQNFGKSATETQQDLMNYILAGNTAEIERSPFLMPVTA
jgi:chromosome segregation ATPase